MGTAAHAIEKFERDIRNGALEEAALHVYRCWQLPEYSGYTLENFALAIANDIRGMKRKQQVEF